MLSKIVRARLLFFFLAFSVNQNTTLKKEARVVKATSFLEMKPRNWKIWLIRKSNNKHHQEGVTGGDHDYDQSTSETSVGYNRGQ